MVIKLYSMMASPPVRAVILTLKSIGIPYELENLNLLKQEHHSEEFKKLNPQHTIPTIEDDGFVIWDSHAINAYLINKYGKDDKLYPVEPKARAVVDQRLHFDTGVLFVALRTTSIEIFFKKSLKKMTPEFIEMVENAYAFIEKFLDGNLYIAGNNITIADFSFVTTIANLKVLVPIQNEKFPLLSEYLKRCEANIPSLKTLNDEGNQEILSLLEKFEFEIPSQ